MRRVARQLNIYLREDEYQSFMKAFQNTVYRTRTDYARRLVLGKPVTIMTRNRSLDDFIELGVNLRKELLLLLAKDTFSVAEKENLMGQITLIEELLNNIIKKCRRK
jgi:hypothetical protein